MGQNKKMKGPCMVKMEKNLENIFELLFERSKNLWKYCGKRLLWNTELKRETKEINVLLQSLVFNIAKEEKGMINNRTEKFYY